MTDKQSIALITGAGRGLGRAVADNLLQQGYTVVATDYSPALLEGYAGLENVVTRVMDVTSAESVSAVANYLQNTFGRLDVLINNAGIIDYGPVTERDPEDTIRLFQVNTFGSLRVVHACLDLLEKAKGRVVCVTSESYRLRPPFQAYQPSKLALEGLADVMRRELAHLDIHVATVRPGAIKTELFESMNHIENPVPEGRLAAPFKRFTDMLLKSPPTRVSTPEQVAAVVARAAREKKPRPHYEINNMLSMKIANLLPKRWVDALLHRTLRKSKTR